MASACPECARLDEIGRGRAESYLEHSDMGYTGERTGKASLGHLPPAAAASSSISIRWHMSPSMDVTFITSASTIKTLNHDESDVHRQMRGL